MRNVSLGHHVKKTKLLSIAMVIMLTALICFYALPVTAPTPEYEKIIWFTQVLDPPPEDKTIWFIQISGPGGEPEPITRFEYCKWYRVVDTEPYQPDFVPPPCSWWHVFWPDHLNSIMFHVDQSFDRDFHIDEVRTEPPTPVIIVDPPVDVASADWFPNPDTLLGPVDRIEPCKWYKVVGTEPYQPDFVPPPCSWWHIFFPPEVYCTRFHVDKSCWWNKMFHIDKVLPAPIPEIFPPLAEVAAEWVPEQEHRYVVMGTSTINSAGQLGANPPWDKTSWMVGGGVPFATRAPYITPNVNWQNITFSSRDEETGVVDLTVPKESYQGVDHVYFSPRVGTYFRVRILWLEEDDGCGWLFTGNGTAPILGDVDIATWSNNTGTYFFGPDGLPGTLDDQFISSATVRVPPCLGGLTGLDGIPGTPDDNFGTLNTTGGTPRTPDPKGSSILFLPTDLLVEYWTGVEWSPLFMAPWPQILTTATASNKVIEPTSLIDGANNKETGEPWECMHSCRPWGDDTCKIWVRYVCSYAVLEIATAMGPLDVHFIVDEYKLREDYVRGFPPSNALLTDITGPGDTSDRKVNIRDIATAAAAFGSEDEGFGKPVATGKFDARADITGPEDPLGSGQYPSDGKVNIRDIAMIAKDFGFDESDICS